MYNKIVNLHRNILCKFNKLILTSESFVLLTLKNTIKIFYYSVIFILSIIYRHYLADEIYTF